MSQSFLKQNPAAMTSTVAYPPEIVTPEQRREYDRQFAAGFAARLAFENELEQKRLQEKARLPRYAGNRHTRRSMERNLKKRVATAKRIGETSRGVSDSAV